MAQAACPSCGVVLDRAPKRRSQCTHCHQPIVVREGRLCTEDEARAIDVCSRFAVPLERLWDAREQLSRTWGRAASAADAAWRVLNEVIVEMPDFHGRGMVYFQMARFLWEEGRDHLQVARQGRRMRLAHWKHAEDLGLLDLKRARLGIVTARDASCPACRALEGAQFSYLEAAERNPIPVAECTHEAGPGRTRGWCRCDYVLHP